MWKNTWLAAFLPATSGGWRADRSVVRRSRFAARICVPATRAANHEQRAANDEL
jgi:hypothetical protein